MFENQIPRLIWERDRSGPYLLARRRTALQGAVQLYQTARMKALWRQIWLRLLRKPNRLLELSEIAPVGLYTRHHSGVKSVRIDKIRGSENRSQDFDAEFLPLRANSRFRWQQIASLMLMDETLPPVELIQVGNQYFVRDGHHRISVARAMGQKHIDAEITVWQHGEVDAIEKGQLYPQRVGNASYVC